MPTNDDTPTPTPTGPADPHGHRMRDGNNRFARNPLTAANDARAAELRSQHWTYDQIAKELGYKTKTGARDAVHRAIRDACAGPGKALIDLEVERLEAMYDEVLDILYTNAPVVSHGRIICGDDGEPLVDQELKLKAVDRALRTRESFRKLLGLDAPSRVSVEAEQLGREIGRLLDTALGPDEDGTSGDTDA